MSKVRHAHTNVMTIANGFVEPGRNPLNRKIAIVFDDETFDQIKALAVENRCSFAQMVRDLCDIGLAEYEPFK
jgi:hypothetical protein